MTCSKQTPARDSLVPLQTLDGSRLDARCENQVTAAMIKYLFFFFFYQVEYLEALKLTFNVWQNTNISKEICLGVPWGGMKFLWWFIKNMHKFLTLI